MSLVDDQKVAAKVEIRRCVGVLDDLDRPGREPLDPAGLHAVFSNIQMRSASRQRNDVVEKLLFPSPHHNVVRRKYPYRTTLTGRGDDPCDEGRYGCLADT